MSSEGGGRVVLSKEEGELCRVRDEGKFCRGRRESYVK